MLASPLTVMAKDKDHHKDHNRGRHSQRTSSTHHHHGGDRHDWYRSRPSSSFTLSFGTGYAGRGYYYGPPGAAYYYERPDVRFYPTRESYYSNSYTRGYSPIELQRALANRGYYYGPIDGDIGPGSRNAIARYQADHGMSPSGSVTTSLLRSLNL